VNFTDKEIDELIKGVFDGEIDKENLPENLYTAIAEFLQGGLYKGFGGSVADFGGTDLNLLQELRTNIYMFSAAKTYQEVRSMTDLMYEGDNLKPFKDFYEDAKGLYDTYNKNYAETEYNTAVASAEMGAKWNEIVKDADLFPLLKMTVVEDAQTTEICEPLDGITLPINDPFWDEFYPPNHWNCRSTVLQLDEGEVSSKLEVNKAKEHADEDMQDVFKMNVGKDEFVFSPEHPYFTNVPRGDREFAKENFGLPLPEDLIPTFDAQKERIYNIFKEGLNVDIKKGVQIADTLSLETFTKVNNQMESLFNEYKPSTVWRETSTPNLKLQSTGLTFGSITHSNDGSFLYDINLGHQNDIARIKIPTNPINRTKSRVIEANLSISTPTHEFAHLLSIDSQKYRFDKDERLSGFWPEMKRIKTRYTKELNKAARINDLESVDKIFLGRYASKNINEFMAESFTEYKLYDKPTKYAVEVGKLIDKTFKR